MGVCVIFGGEGCLGVINHHNVLCRFTPMQAHQGYHPALSITLTSPWATGSSEPKLTEPTGLFEQLQATNTAFDACLDVQFVKRAHHNGDQRVG